MTSRWARWTIAALLAATFAPSAARADKLDRARRRIAGQIVDHTHNHDGDRRFFSKSLGIPRDAYVYLPPAFDPNRSYPLLLWLHGFGGDERQFLAQVVEALDCAIRDGRMPPVIAACPDASRPTSLLKPWHAGSWYLNSQQGCWEDFVVRDFMTFLTCNYPIRPEPELHVIAGWSMGGFASYNLGFKHPDLFRVLVGIYPNANLRYCDSKGHYRKNFDPDDVGFLEDLHFRDRIGFYPRTFVPIYAGVVFFPVWGKGRVAIERMSAENPTEMILRGEVPHGVYRMFVAYGGADEYNIDAQVESFLYAAEQTGHHVEARFDPNGHHRSSYVNDCLPDVLTSVGAHLWTLEAPADSPPTLDTAAPM